MDDADVCTKVLLELNRSPLWKWDNPPSLFAVAGDDPPILLPVFSVSSMETLSQIATHWREHHAADTDAVPVDTLMLIAEAWIGPPQDEDRKEIREGVIAHRDGTFRVFRHVRNTEEVAEVDPMDPELTLGPNVETMREVAASAWQ